MSLIWRKFEKCHKCAMSTVTGVVAYVIKNAFSRVRNTDNDMSSRSAAGKLFHTVGPLAAKLRSPLLVVVLGPESYPDAAEHR